MLGENDTKCEGSGELKQILRALALALGIFFWANAGVPQTAQAALPADGVRLYMAQAGDNFLLLSQRVGYAPELLAAMNNLSAGYCCRGGEKLLLPLEPAEEELPDSLERQRGRLLASRSGYGRTASWTASRVVANENVVWAAPLRVPGQVTSAFGSSRSSTGPHHGLDIAVPQGSVILAAHDGVVLEAGWKNDVYGYAVALEHGNGWQTLYAHCSRVLVQTGQQVRQGECIALVGSTGNSTGPHLHLELHKDGAFLDPADFFADLLLEV